MAEGDVLQFAAEVVAVSASGVLAPGPLFVANVLYGAKGGRLSGIKVAHGHAAVELAVIIAIAAGLFTASAFASSLKGMIALAGGAAMLGFAALQIATAASEGRLKKTGGSMAKEGGFWPAAAAGRSPFGVGAVLTAFNPFFIAWWLTAGLKLISDSAAFGPPSPAAGVALLFSLHVWMDYAWLGATAYLAAKGGHRLLQSSKYYRMMLAGLAAALAYYGVQSIMNGAKELLPLLGP